MPSDESNRSDFATEQDLSDRELGDFRLLRRLGRGAMADVYLAQQRSLNRQVAVKVLKSHLAADAGYVQRFQREAQAAAALVHGNIVQIYAVGCIEGIYYIAQEYVPGMNLRQWLTRYGPPEISHALAIMRQVAAALSKAAEYGIVHRDIKPENIFLSPSGEVKVGDFGLARLSRGEAIELTQAGTTLGTPLYMSPEQIEGKPLDFRSDLYSFGVTCYQMLCGKPPFSGETPLAVAVQHLKKQPEPLGTLRPDLPPGLCRIVHKMLAKAPEHRYQSARELLHDLHKLHQELFPDQPAEAFAEWESSLLNTASRTDRQSALQLAKVMETAAMSRPFRPAWALWSFVVVGMFFGGATLAWFVARPKPLLATEETALVVPKQKTVAAQWLYATQLGTEEAWQAVIDYFPEKKYWSYRAKQQLARIYLKEDDDRKAMALFKEFAMLDESEPELRAFGLAGQCWILTKQGKYRQSAEVLSQLLPLRGKLQDPLMQQVLNHTIRKNLAELGPLTARQWEDWLEKHHPDED